MISWSARTELGSTVRALALTTAAPSDLGAMNWRSIAPIRPAGLTALQMHLGDGCMFGLVPMGAGRTYGFAYVVQPRFHDPLEGRLERLRDRFATFGSRVQEYLASLERDDQVICSAMEWMEVEKWHIGRVVLVGDAAHASSPMMGQGGCMAMEDACVLAEELRAAATVESALASYVSRRKPRVEWVQQPKHGSGGNSHRAIGGPQCRAARTRAMKRCRPASAPSCRPLSRRAPFATDNWTGPFWVTGGRCLAPANDGSGPIRPLPAAAANGRLRD